MGRKLSVVLPSGRVVGADEDVAVRAAAAGARRESGEEMSNRATADVTEERFGGAGDKILAGVEGALSGLTFGLADYAMDDEATRTRAAINPVSRGVGEFVGLVLPSVVAPGSIAGRVIRASPAGLVTRAGEHVAAGLGGIKGFAAQGAIEGVAGGVGGAVSHAALSDDPLTLDAAIESATHGGLIGTGIGAIAGGVGLLSRRLAAKSTTAAPDAFAIVERGALERRLADVDVGLATTPKAIKLPADKAAETRLSAIDDELSALQSTTPDLRGASARLKQIDDELARRASDKAAGVGDHAPPIADEVYEALRDDVDALARAAEGRPGIGREIADLESTRVISSKEYRRAARAAGDDLLGQIPDAEKAKYRDQIGALRKRWGALDANPGDPAAAAAHAEAITTLARRANKEPLPMPRHPTALAAEKGDALAQLNLARATGRVDERVALAADVARRMPKTSARFARMNASARAELLNDLQRVAGAEWGAGLKDGLSSFRDTVQVTEGSLSEGVNRLYRDAADTASGRLEKLLTRERRAVEKQMRAATTGSSRDIEAAQKALLREKTDLLSQRAAAEKTAQDAAGDVRRALKDERRALMGDLRGLPEPSDLRVSAKTAESWKARIAAGVAATAFGGPKALLAEITGLRRAITSRVGALIGRHGETAAGAIRRLGSPTARLHQRFLGGDDERGGSDRAAAARRVDELLRLRPAVRDAAYAVAAPLAADAGHGFSLALANRLSAAVDHLVQFLPRDPGTARHLLASDWLPSDAQAEELAIRLEVAATPLVALDRILAGDVDPAAADSLWALWPGVMAEARDELLSRLPEMTDVSMGTVAGLSAAFRTPFDGLLMPHNVAHLQGMYAPRSGPGTPSQASGGGSSSRGPGRPAATDNLTHAQSLTA